VEADEEKNSMRTIRIFGIGTISFFTTLCVAPTFGQTRATAEWSPVKAAAYLDERSGWWMAWPKAARDHGTFCVSCHTMAPFALGRAALRMPLAESSPSANERKFLENVAKRVRLWAEVEPFYPDQTVGLPKTSESRGTESILNSLVLVWSDAPSGRLSEDARAALDHMWSLQLRTGDMSGSWAWLQFHNAPWEGDSQFYGTALAAVAIGSAPGSYQSEPGIQDGIGKLRTWLVKNIPAQTMLDRAVLLWASAKLEGLLSPAQQNAVVDELLAQQKDDGGFSLSSLVGSWKRKDGTPLDTASDGYATGLITFALEQIDVPHARPHVAKAIEWLRRNQQPDGRWSAASLNKQRELSSDAGLFMSDAATAYAVLALTNWNAPVASR
jgi:squalene-hopene/tetraprenyl-beta-curcumene cyclase